MFSADAPATLDSDSQPGAGTPKWCTKLELALAIIISFAASFAAVAGLHNLVALDVAWLHIAGVIVLIRGIALTIVAQLAMAESWRVGVDSRE